ncbi:MAG: phosphotransferase [Steroidobacteraceae bacterium]|jgi:Ser/Thr protein kinase RdoA (MazF antagonist)|nr:phosphotransferase [Steroidobacteraceae bacterium]
MDTATLPMARVSHSVLHPDFIAGQVAARYPLAGPVKAFLLYRGINDVYLVATGGQKFALRVWRRGGREIDMDAVSYEVEFLDFLRNRGFPASAPLRARDGSLYFKVDSPEGARALALYEWAPGRKFGECLDEGTAERIGALFAQLHGLGIEYQGTRPHDVAQVVAFRSNVPALLDFVYDRPEDVRDFAKVAEALAARLLEVRADDLPLGVCHRDFHPSNVHVDGDGRITLLDFDGVGTDYLMQDVQNYRWGNLFYGFDDRYADAFERGYESVRPFTADEKRHADLFLLAKTFRLVSGMAQISVAVGRGTLRFRSLDWLGGYIRDKARPLGLL